eukprot:Skav216433  [mRNA]  locus=scaffold3139:434672:438016:- [translate_table: standard]
MHAMYNQQSFPDAPPLQCLQIASWNVRGKSLMQIADVLSDQGIHFDIITLQEVGGLSQGTVTPAGFLNADDPALQMHEELNDYWIVGTDHVDSHLGQAILVDKSFATGVLHSLKGSRFIGAQILHKGGAHLWVLSGHLPHHHRPLSDYIAALQDLRRLLQRVHPLPTLIAADWNAIPLRANLDSQALELSCLAAEQDLRLLLPENPTWKDKVYDFFALSPSFQRCLAASAVPVELPRVVPGLDALLPSDHQLVSWDATLAWPPRRPSSRRRQAQMGRWQVDPAQLQHHLEHTPAQATWPSLCSLARACQYRLRARKFQDSDALKELCRTCNRTTDALQRASLSRHILTVRQAERDHWFRDLYASASAGDTAAVAFLKNKLKPRISWTPLIAHTGSREAATHQVQQHFQQVFANTSPSTRDADCLPHLAILEGHMQNIIPQPIQADDLHACLLKLKLAKASGGSGMSNEFLLCLGRTQQGETLLLRFLNHMFLTREVPPQLLIGLATLIPKTMRVTEASAIRPILLLEVLQKLFAAILMHRLLPHWPPITCQAGAIPGGQPIEPIFSAHAMLALSKVTYEEPLFLKLDIKGAFDNLRHASVAAFLATLNPQACHEAMGLMQLLLGQQISFSFLDTQWHLQTANGTPQGGSHSAGLFARTLDHAIGAVLRDWEVQGHVPIFAPIWLLLYVDDILLCFKSWSQATELLPSFLDKLKTLGFHINYDKSCLVLSAAMHASAPAPNRLQLLARFQWVEQTQYLRKPFGYNLDTHALHHQALQSIYSAWGQLRSVLKRCHWRQPGTTVRMMDQYVGAAFLWLSPVLFPYQLFRQRLRNAQTTLVIEALNLYIPSMQADDAHQLLQFRRHVVKRWLLHMTLSGSWEIQYIKRYWSFLGHVCRQGFHGRHPARVMLHQLAMQHSRTLSRPGPWFTPRSLLAKFWKEAELDEDYMFVSSDREAWKDLTSTFLAWLDLAPLRGNVEFLDCSPWNHPRCLLRMHVAWLRTVFIGMPGGSFAAAWFDEVEGYSFWRSPATMAPTEDQTSILTIGLRDLCQHLSMIQQPFVLQVAVANEMDWRYILDQQSLLSHILLDCAHASWYQFFPLSEREKNHRSLTPFVTYFL